VKGAAEEPLRLMETAPESEQPVPTGEGAGGGRDPARIAVVLIAIVVMVGVVTYLGPILKPFLIAVFVFFSTRAAAAILIRLRFPVLFAYLTLFAAGSVLAAVVALLAYGEGLALHDAWTDPETGYHQRILALIKQAPHEASGPLADLFTDTSKVVFQQVFERGLGTLELLTMMFFYLLFIFLGAGKVSRRVERAFPGGQGARVLAMARKIGTGMEQFMQVKTLVSLGMGASAALLLYLFGVRSCLLWGILFFAFNYITYIGSFVACVPPIVLAFLDLGSPVTAAVLAVLVVLNRFFWIDYIEIKMAGRHLNIDSILLFLWLAYWGWVWGVIGLILAFPMLTSLKIVLESLESTRGLAVLMSDE
jgi:predicted PurR-regulated permease PerM